jgi:hypothetical protein
MPRTIAAFALLQISLSTVISPSTAVINPSDLGSFFLSKLQNASHFDLSRHIDAWPGR